MGAKLKTQKNQQQQKKRMNNLAQASLQARLAVWGSARTSFPARIRHLTPGSMRAPQPPWARRGWEGGGRLRGRGQEPPGRAPSPVQRRPTSPCAPLLRKSARTRALRPPALAYRAASPLHWENDGGFTAALHPQPIGSTGAAHSPPPEHFHQEGTWTETAASAVSPRTVTPLRGHPKPH